VHHQVDSIEDEFSNLYCGIISFYVLAGHSAIAIIRIAENRMPSPPRTHSRRDEKCAVVLQKKLKIELGIGKS
jgi:hypothetical protein